MIDWSPAKSFVLAAALAAGLAPAAHAADAPAPTTQKATRPAVGEKIRDVALETLDGKTVKLATLQADGPVVLVVLRGWPGYQCPICTRQVADLLAKADDFQAAGAKVVLIYPGPADRLGEHAREFLRGKDLKPPFQFFTDPGFAFTNAYGLRWDAPKETAYPSTLVADKAGVFRFVKISGSHGDRAATADVLKALAAPK